MSHAQVAEKVGRSREYVSNSIRLLGLPEHMLDSLKYGDMMEGHARTLLMLSDRPEEQEVVYKEILLKKLSVREVERIVRKIATDKVRKKNPKDLDSHLIEFEKKFTETLGTRVQIQKTDFGGKLTIDYFSEDDLVLILSKMNEEGKVLPVNRQEELEKIATHTPLQMVDEPVATEPINQLSHETAAIETEPNPVNQPEQDKFISLVDQVEEESVHRETIEPVVLEDAPIETMAEAKEDNLATESTDTSSSEWPNQAFQRPSEVTTVNANPSPVFGITEDPSSRPETLTETRHEHEADQQPKRDNEDDSNLYSINNFTV